VSAIRLNKAHYPVTVLGYGRRLGIWVQGCSIGCAGCCSQDTWDSAGGTSTDIDALVAWCRDAVGDDALDGVTISGGEPFEQSDALAELLVALRAWTDARADPVDYLCYSGLPLRRVREHAAILAQLDAVIAEPFVRTLEAAPLRGSSNQSVAALTPLGTARYGTLPEMPKRMQIQVAPEHIWMIGIPDSSDLAKLENLCATKGLKLGKVSWRA